MLLEEDLKKNNIWEKEVLKKLLNFSKKAPTLISVSVGMNEGTAGIFVTHVNSERKYFFGFNYNVEPKDFIHEIKNVLMENHYPRLVEIVYDRKELSTRDIVLKLEKGKKLENIQKCELKPIGKRLYIIEKCLLWKDLFILKLMESSFPSDIIGQQSRWKYNKSSVIYLKHYRSNSFKSLEEASDEFFKNSLIIDVLAEPKYMQEA
jgi:hypothetical protein